MPLVRSLNPATGFSVSKGIPLVSSRRFSHPFPVHASRCSRWEIISSLGMEGPRRDGVLGFLTHIRECIALAVVRSDQFHVGPWPSRPISTSQISFHHEFTAAGWTGPWPVGCARRWGCARLSLVWQRSDGLQRESNNRLVEGTEMKTMTKVRGRNVSSLFVIECCCFHNFRRNHPHPTAMLSSTSVPVRPFRLPIPVPNRRV